MEVGTLIEHASFVPNILRDDVAINKPLIDWTYLDKKKVKNDWKTRSILISNFGADEYYRVYEGINEVKHSKVFTHVRV